MVTKKKDVVMSKLDAALWKFSGYVTAMPASAVFHNKVRLPTFTTRQNYILKSRKASNAVRLEHRKYKI